DVLRLVRIERQWSASGHIAERAGARADAAEDHEGGVLDAPAFTDVGAAGLLTHRVQFEVAHERLGLVVARTGGGFDADRVGLAGAGRIGTAFLFRMAGTFAFPLGAQINEIGHEPKMSFPPLTRNVLGGWRVCRMDAAWRRHLPSPAAPG